MEHRILHDPSGPKALAAWLSQSPRKAVSLLWMTPDARFPDWVTAALGQRDDILVGGIVDHLGPQPRRPGLALTTISSSSWMCAPFILPPKSLRFESKAVGRWPERLTDSKDDTLRPSGFQFDDKDFSSPEGKKASNVVKSLKESLKRQVEWNPNLVLVLAGAEEAREGIGLLDICFPNASKMGLVASQTPFVTGTRHWLLGPKRIPSSGGLVGLALKQSENSTSFPWRLQTNHPSLEPLGTPLQISKARGNLILGLKDGASATKELLERISKTPSFQNSKDSRSLFVSVSSDKKPMDQQSGAIFRITGGDPSKGLLALNTDKELLPGMWIQFLMDSEGTGRRITLSTKDDTTLLTFTKKEESETPSKGTFKPDETLEPPSLQVSSVSGIISGVPSGGKNWTPTLVHDDINSSVSFTISRP